MTTPSEQNGIIEGIYHKAKVTQPLPRLQDEKQSFPPIVIIDPFGAVIPPHRALECVRPSNVEND